MPTQAQDYSTPAALHAGSENPDTQSGAVRRAFKDRKSSVRSWALAHGWAPRSVYTVIERWVEHPLRRGKMPLGGVNRAIVAALHDELGGDIVPLPDSVGRPAMERAA